MIAFLKRFKDSSLLLGPSNQKISSDTEDHQK